jgi:alkylation response protein AidB-like acyl-CoA dehydrogenase
MMTDSDREMIADSLRALFAAHWPVDQADARSVDPVALGAIWDELCAQGFHQIGMPDGLGLEAGVIAAREAGRFGCPAPLISTIAANLTGANATGPVATALDVGGLDYAGGRLTGKVHFIENAQVAEQIVLSVPGGLVIASLRKAAIEYLPGLAVPALATAAFDSTPASFTASDKVAAAALAERLLLAARALGATQRAFELVLDHVQQRVQFGQPLARFQSMQHKLADCQLILDSSALLIAEAARQHDSGEQHWRFAANAAIAYASALRRVSLETHHAFGAIGYAEEHEAPRHFRRVHADLVRMGGVRRARAELAAHMLEGSGTLPARAFDAEVEAFRAELLDWVAANWNADHRAANRARPFVERGHDSTFERAFGAAGYLSVAWPKEFGGKSARPLSQMVLMEELERVGAPTSGIVAAAWLIAPEIIRHGTPFLQKELLPGIAAGQVKFALGYSEPEAGSDLSSLRTRAVRDGDHYVVTGQKLWGTGTEHATHIALAVRTDPEAASNAQGISVLLVPADLPGITIQPGMALYGHTFCTQFYDEVRVPVEYLLGAENKGWGVLSGALAAERVTMGGQVARVTRVFEEFCAHVASVPNLASDPFVRDIVGQFAAEQEAARQLALRSLLVLEARQLPIVEGAMTKVFSGDLTERLCEAMLDVLGTAGSLGEDSTGAPLDGHIEQLLRRSIMLVVGGGAAEIQKTIIAQRGLGLPR